MTEPNEAMKAMARRIAAATCLPNCDQRRILDGHADGWHGVKSALAAIIETQRLDAELAEANDGYNDITGTSIARLIRTGNHYGKDEG